MKVICFINMKGGVAKTTLAINIADCLAQRREQRVLVIDIDPQFNATQCLMKPDDYVSHIQGGKDTIINVFDRQIRVAPSAARKTEEKEPKQLSDIEPIVIKNLLHLLPGNLDLFRIEMAPGEGRENRLKVFLETLKEKNMYDYVIIDTPPTPSIWMTSALIASDYYLIPVRPDPISFTGLDLLRAIIKEKSENFNLTIRCIGIVLTVTEDGTIVLRNATQHLKESETWKDHFFKTLLPKRTRIARDQLECKTILDSDQNDAKLNLTHITDELLERIAQA